MENIVHIIFWKKQRDKALAKKIYRLERELLTGHIDRKITMPQEVKDAQAKKAIPQRCIDKITKEHEAYVRRVHVPSVKRPERLSHG